MFRNDLSYNSMAEAVPVTFASRHLRAPVQVQLGFLRIGKKLRFEIDLVYVM